MSNKYYTVIGSTDDNYAKYLGVVFNSILRKSSKKEWIKFYCIDGGISDINKNFIIEAVKKEGGNVEFIDVDTNEYDDIDTIKHITKAAFYRISIPKILSKDLDKVLYVDCDVIICDDVTKLWDMNIEEYDVAAVENTSSRTHLKTGLAQSDYFNSGVLLMNLKRWRQEDLSRKITSFKKNNPDKISTNDQCAINCVINNNWYRLPLKWNHQTGLYRNNDIRERYSFDEINQALKAPSIVHFIGIDKPWNKYCYHPWQQYYIKEAKKAGLSIEKASFLQLFFSSLKTFSSFKKFIRTRIQYLQLR